MGPVIVNGDPVGALLIGRSSATLNGLQILVGLIDKDYCGEIQIIVSAMFPPMHVPRNTKIAQLPGLPNPAMIPEGWHLLIVDLKDCFFTIALHENDKQRFALTLPAINREGPDQRFEWTLLPQGRRNSPMLCQLYVDAALQPIRRKWPETIIYHYMDDILLAQKEPFSLQQKNDLTLTLKQMGLVLTPEKVQETSPWKFLGWKITNSTIQPQKLTIQSDIKTLNDAQKLLGDLQWIRPVVGIPNELLNPLQPLLKGTDPASKVTLSEKQQEILQQIASLITTSVTHRRISDKPLDLTVLCGSKCLMGAITQQKIKTGEKGGETVVLEWIAPPLQPRRTIQEKIATLSELVKKGRNRILQVDGVPPNIIWLPMKPGDLEWYIQNSEELQAALLQDGATIVAKTLQSTALTWMENQGWITKPKRSSIPLKNAVTVFTDAGKRSRTAAVTWKDEHGWKHQILQAQDKDSLQTLELLAVVWAFIKWRDVPLNVVSDSLYVVGQIAIAQRSEPYAVIHIRSHQWEEGLGEGNARADRLVAATATEAPLSPFCRTREAHAIFHQNAKGLARAYKLSRADAQAIVKACPTCSHYNSGVGIGIGINPRGIKTNEVWQMDVTHVTAFGRLRYLHVTIDTYMIWAIPQPGEKVRDVRRHLASCFAVMGVPQTIKTDNGPAYVSGPLKRFMELWDIKHITGIPHSPTGQAIVERANGTVKQYLEKFKDITDIRERVDKTLFVLNHLCVFGDDEEPPATRHYIKSENDNKCIMRVLY
uniref:Uncharacterized protein n=1 Tax=Anas platyrhynchos platyrhynchos TaxID=8840 RepID=A0A493TJ10_ANAPP